MNEKVCPVCDGEGEVHLSGLQPCPSCSALPPVDPAVQISPNQSKDLEVDPAVLDRAVEVACEAFLGERRWNEEEHEADKADWREDMNKALAAAAPIIAAAAYRQGREDGLREASEAVGRVQMPEHQGYGTYKGHFDAGVGACRAALRSLLTDKEGE